MWRPLHVICGSGSVSGNGLCQATLRVAGTALSNMPNLSVWLLG